MTPITVTTHSRFLLRGAVITAEISSRFLDSVRALFPRVPCRPANETADVRALANSLPHKGSGLSVELMGPVGRPFPSRYLPPL